MHFDAGNTGTNQKRPTTGKSPVVGRFWSLLMLVPLKCIFAIICHHVSFDPPFGLA
jgi:hypothetical protein